MYTSEDPPDIWIELYVYTSEDPPDIWIGLYVYTSEDPPDIWIGLYVLWTYGSGCTYVYTLGSFKHMDLLL